jgi:hypothetical protein
MHLGRVFMRIVIATLLLASGCALPLNGTGPDDPTPAARPVARPVARLVDAGAQPDSGTIPFNPPGGDIPLNLTACDNPPAPGYARTLPAQCVSLLSYWTTVNVVYFTADGTCELAGQKKCACDYTCKCVTHDPTLGLSQCTCSQATPDSVLILNCPTP